MTADDITLDEAVKILSLPRLVGIDPTDEKPIEAFNGKFGPYIKKGTDSRSIESKKRSSR
ncbi:MAG: topoisomerase C-terminal repeat-containing protein [Acidimicrobiales bacterium]